MLEKCWYGQIFSPKKLSPPQGLLEGIMKLFESFQQGFNFSACNQRILQASLTRDDSRNVSENIAVKSLNDLHYIASGIVSFNF